MPNKPSRRDDARRVNKDRRTRIEELRRQQRATERRKNLITFGSAIGVAVILIGGVTTAFVLKDAHKAAKSKSGFQAAPTADESAAGCTGVHNDPVSPAGHHLTTPIDYSTQKYGDTAGGTAAIPPSGGAHNAVSLGDTNRFYPLAQSPRPERAVHNLEHGFVVVWYDAKLPADQVAKLQALAAQPSLSRLLVVGWWQSDLPAGKHFVLTSWGRTDRCTSVSESVIRTFYAQHLNSSLSPEAGLPAIQGADTIPPGQLPGPKAPAASMSPMPSPSAKK